MTKVYKLWLLRVMLLGTKALMNGAVTHQNVVHACGAHEGARDEYDGTHWLQDWQIFETMKAAIYLCFIWCW